MSYQVDVGTEQDAIVLRPRGHLDASAGRHLLELARLATHGLRCAVRIDLEDVCSTTPGATKLLNPRELNRLPGEVTVRAPGRTRPLPAS